ncbi:MAG: hypothetical protein KDD89_04000 [Anaerolineales bacterium]|nr:hypothetical protein [Anaerolineales bacterium]
MKISGSYRFSNLSPTAVWPVLLDPSLLKEALPHPVSEMHGLIYQRQGTFRFAAHVGPFAEHVFTLRLAFTDKTRPWHYTAQFEVVDENEQSTLRGESQWQLTADEADTIATYDLTPHATGEFDEVGALLVETMLRSGVRQTLAALEQWLHRQPVASNL